MTATSCCNLSSWCVHSILYTRGIPTDSVILPLTVEEFICTDCSNIYEVFEESVVGTTTTVEVVGEEILAGTFRCL